MNLFFSLFIFFGLISFPSLSKQVWILDKELSNIEFELPILLAKNVRGTFKEIEGLIQIDLDEKNNNKAIFSVNIDSIEMNYKKYKNLLLSNIFFDSKKYPKALIDTKKFSYKDEDTISLDAELTIKGVTNSVPLNLEIISLAEELVQIKGELKFLRTTYKIGTKPWENTSILKDEASINVNLFLFKE